MTMALLFANVWENGVLKKDDGRVSFAGRSWGLLGRKGFSRLLVGRQKVCSYFCVREMYAFFVCLFFELRCFEFFLYNEGGELARVIVAEMMRI